VDGYLETFTPVTQSRLYIYENPIISAVISLGLHNVDGRMSHTRMWVCSNNNNKFLVFAVGWKTL
jgi:hypothetical protein